MELTIGHRITVTVSSLHDASHQYQHILDTIDWAPEFKQMGIVWRDDAAVAYVAPDGRVYAMTRCTAEPFGKLLFNPYTSGGIQ
jgi:hypothetical protein